MAKAPGQQINFRKLYNKTYGDIAQVGRGIKLNPQQFFEFAVEYFTWAESQAIAATETAAFQGHVYETGISKPRIFTIGGLALFCSISPSCFVEWRKKPGYKEVMEFVDGVIYEQKFQLAANGIVNAGFIIKDLNLGGPDTEINIENKNVSSSVTTEEFKEAVRDILGDL